MATQSVTSPPTDYSSFSFQDAGNSENLENLGRLTRTVQNSCSTDAEKTEMYRIISQVGQQKSEQDQKFIELEKKLIEYGNSIDELKKEISVYKRRDEIVLVEQEITKRCNEKFKSCSLPLLISTLNFFLKPIEVEVPYQTPEEQDYRKLVKKFMSENEKKNPEILPMQNFEEADARYSEVEVRRKRICDNADRQMNSEEYRKRPITEHDRKMAWERYGDRIQEEITAF